MVLQQHAHNHRRCCALRSVVPIVAEDQRRDDGVFERTAGNGDKDPRSADEVCTLAADLADLADKRIVADPEAPRFVDPAFSVVDADARATRDETR